MVNDKNNKLLTKKRKKVIKGIFLVKTKIILIMMKTKI